MYVFICGVYECMCLYVGCMNVCIYVGEGV